jgi:hypothetical protein
VIAVLIAAVVVAASPTPTAAPAALSTTPLREVVYKVSTWERVDDITESFGGGPGAAPPASTDMGMGEGTVTVDVMAKFEDSVLGVKVTEKWESSPSPMHFTGAVAPDGTVEFALNTINPVTVELLPYFATHFAPEGALVSGVHWTVDKESGKTDVETTYTVTEKSDNLVTVHKDTTIKALGSETVDGTIVYDPSLLVPISGQIRVRRTEMFSNGQATRTIDLKFDRQSDTFGATATP